MPELLAPSLETRVQRAVEQAIAARRVELEQLVRARVDLELRQLAGELVAAQLATNGNGAAPTADPVAAATKPCAGPCGRTLPASAFDRHRRVCKDCRRESLLRSRERRRAAAPADAEEPPRADTAADG